MATHFCIWLWSTPLEMFSCERQNARIRFWWKQKEHRYTHRTSVLWKNSKATAWEDTFALLKRVYLKSGNMTNSEGFSRSANHFFAGILNVFQGKMVRRYGKRTAVWACWQFSVRPIMPHAISSSCAYRIRPRHPGMGIQQTRACVTLSLGFLPPPGAPRAALSLRKYHWYRYLSSLAFGSNPKVIRERIVARRSPDNNGNVSAVRYIQLLSMITDLQRDVNAGAWMFCK